MLLPKCTALSSGSWSFFPLSQALTWCGQDSVASQQDDTCKRSLHPGYRTNHLPTLITSLSSDEIVPRFTSSGRRRDPSNSRILHRSDSTLSNPDTCLSDCVATKASNFNSHYKDMEYQLYYAYIEYQLLLWRYRVSTDTVRSTSINCYYHNVVEYLLSRRRHWISTVAIETGFDWFLWP